MRQQGVLLALVKTVDLVNEQNRGFAVLAAGLGGAVHHQAQVFDAAHHGRQALEDAADFLGQQAGQCGLATARRAPQNKRGQLFLLQQLMQGSLWA